jgi:hypothetical protein
MEAHVEPETRVSSKDVDRVEKGIRKGDPRETVFPRLSDVATTLGLTGPRAVALRRHLGIEDDDSCRHDFQFGSTQHRQYSDNALTKMREAVRDLDMDAIWKAHNPAGRACPQCSVQGCKAS